MDATPSSGLPRRRFLQSGAAALLASCTPAANKIEGSIIGANSTAGHWLRDLKAPPAPQRTVRTDVVIAGGGVSGLVAALRLQEAGVEHITLLDLEAAPGGNARSGKNPISSYPWGAHYVPAPGENALEVRKLFSELGVITGQDAAGRPVYDETYICSDPQERLFYRGVWQEGLLPAQGGNFNNAAEVQQFNSRIDELKKARGRDGKRVFTIPLDESSQDPDWLALDQITMEAWMIREGLTSEALRWYVNYCCRDDYGAGMAEVSAWAGLHYFASRDDNDLLTWPEGNGWLVQRIMERLSAVTFQSAVVYHLENTKDGVICHGYLPATGEAVSWEARAAVCALPRFVAQRLVTGLSTPPPMTYSPWAVANLSWRGVCSNYWDNVFESSHSLGYVVATHQSLNPFLTDTVLTWYRPLDHLPPAQARQEALQKPWTAWRDEIIADFQPAHPEVEEHLSRADVMLWGHGMIRPVPGYISHPQRRALAQPLGRIAFAHTDMSGISLFEEACTRGAAAAKEVAHWLGIA